MNEKRNKIFLKIVDIFLITHYTEVTFVDQKSTEGHDSERTGLGGSRWISPQGSASVRSLSESE